jgi:NAD(P)-dependent dehydrogenase (short-subunit alcohol dehydrogenase family)
MVDPQLLNLLELRGQVALITGASRGIGFAIADLFCAAGARVAINGRDQATLDTSMQQLAVRHTKAEITAVAADVAVSSEAEAMVAQVHDRWSKIDILVNNAAIISAGAYHDIDLDEWNRVLTANLTGAFTLARLVAPQMEAQRHGRIINIASISAQTGGISGGAHYAASKGGMISLTKTLARDLAPYNVTVNAIAPGQIDTRPDLLTAEARERIVAQIPLGRLGDPYDIANAVLFLASAMGSYITGATVDVNGGILKR